MIALARSAGAIICMLVGESRRQPRQPGAGGRSGGEIGARPQVGALLLIRAGRRTTWPLAGRSTIRLHSGHCLGIRSSRLIRGAAPGAGGRRRALLGRKRASGSSSRFNPNWNSRSIRQAEINH